MVRVAAFHSKETALAAFTAVSSRWSKFHSELLRRLAGRRSSGFCAPKGVGVRLREKLRSLGARCGVVNRVGARDMMWQYMLVASKETNKEEVTGEDTRNGCGLITVQHRFAALQCRHVRSQWHHLCVRKQSMVSLLKSSSVLRCSQDLSMQRNRNGDCVDQFAVHFCR